MEDFYQNVFWSIFSILGQIMFYLLIGYIWIHIKLYLDVWLGHLPTDFHNGLTQCSTFDDKLDMASCFMNQLLEHKWLLSNWMLTWPISAVYTLSRDPLQLITDVAFEWSKERYVYIITSALSADTSDIHIGFIFLYFFGYLFMGYIWTHIKLFVDVWQGSLPKRLDEHACAVYNGDKNYWSFVIEIKWLIMSWTIMWPFSLVYTLLRHPMRIMAEFIYKLSQKKYVAITDKAMEMRFKEE